ncbi:hypothetical protein EWH08_07310 [Sphingobium indicum]|uniref:Uncharacterized protein n=2 Tax=Sphingobium indicum TaxID=332055 RepID=A0A1L5BP19_SPHIB|nr:hypothetical protein [Sphingobium indicum]APL94512.1 hypothetical protein SIDU_08380 [Sphingobium indicum B90A]KEY99051.1 hypothetical protein AI27_07315 [Sphingomonas sp. BHC-A]NYI23358.1 hypothetical protein [Sphingobium indicum]RYM04261.1 hypothetical protein EWH08_07310 [Sphingobium indicum]
MMNDKTDIRPNSREEAGDKRPTDAQDHAVTTEEKLDEGLMDSMDASDPPSATAPGDNGDPVPSSGFPEGEQGPGGKGHPEGKGGKDGR